MSLVLECPYDDPDQTCVVLQACLGAPKFNREHRHVQTRERPVAPGGDQDLTRRGGDLAVLDAEGCLSGLDDEHLRVGMLLQLDFHAG